MAIWPTNNCSNRVKLIGECKFGLIYYNRLVEAREVAIEFISIGLLIEEPGWEL